MPFPQTILKLLGLNLNLIRKKQFTNIPHFFYQTSPREVLMCPCDLTDVCLDTGALRLSELLTRLWPRRADDL